MAPKQWQPDARDAAMLRRLYEVELATAAQVVRLYRLDGALSDGAIHARLQRLLAEDWLERAKPPSKLPPQQVGYLYQATAAVHALLAPLPDKRRHRRHQPLSDATLKHPDHALAVADFALMCWEDPTYTVIWDGEHAGHLTLSAREWMEPDGTITLADGTGRFVQIWYECDRGTEWMPREWGAKLKHYALALAQRPEEAPPIRLCVTAPDVAARDRLALFIGQTGAAY